MFARLPSGTESLVLELLAEHGDLYGLQLVELSDGQLKRGTVYVTLARLQDKGLVRVLRDLDSHAHAGMPRPRYRLTAHGSRVLQALGMVRAALRPATGRA